MLHAININILQKRKSLAQFNLNFDKSIICFEIILMISPDNMLIQKLLHYSLKI